MSGHTSSYTSIGNEFLAMLVKDYFVMKHIRFNESQKFECGEICLDDIARRIENSPPILKDSCKYIEQ